MKKQTIFIFTIIYSIYSNPVFSQTNSWFTWGNNSFGEFGNGTIGSGSSFFEPTKSNHLDSFKEIFPAKLHVYALDKENKLWSWGYNGLKGQLGINSNKSYFETPQKVETSNTWKTMSSQDQFSAGIKSDGTLWVWGRYQAYPSNYGGTNGIDETLPVLIDTSTNWRAVKVGSTHILGLRNDNTLWALGLNTAGALGIAGDGSFNPTKAISPQFVMKDVAYFETHGATSFAIDKYGYFYIWGASGGLKITDGNQNYYKDSVYYTIPHLVTNDSNWKEVKIKGSHALALKKDGTLWTWGGNEFGQLGLGNYNNSDIPTQIGFDKNWKSISAGNSNSFAIKTDGTLWSWGRGGEFLGLGFGTKDQNLPKQISNDSSWNGLKSGSWFSLASKKVVNAVSINNHSNSPLSFGPNPTNENITFSFGLSLKDIPSEIKIYDHTGRLLVFELISDITNFSYPIKANLGAGLFIINVSNGGQSILNKKIIVN